MAVDLSDAAQAAVVAALKAGVTLASVFSVVPDKQALPTVVVPSSIAEPIGGKHSRAERHEITVRTSVAGTSKRALLAIMHQVKEALDDQVLSFDGVLLSRPVLATSSEARDLDLPALIGEQVFSIIVQPA